MKKFICDRCGRNIGLDKDKREDYYDVSRSSELSRFGHKGEHYICESCMKKDSRYKKENEVTYSKSAGC